MPPHCEQIIQKSLVKKDPDQLAGTRSGSDRTVVILSSRQINESKTLAGKASSV